MSYSEPKIPKELECEEGKIVQDRVWRGVGILAERLEYSQSSGGRLIYANRIYSSRIGKWWYELIDLETLDMNKPASNLVVQVFGSRDNAVDWLYSEAPDDQTLVEDGFIQDPNASNPELLTLAWKYVTATIRWRKANPYGSWSGVLPPE